MTRDDPSPDPGAAERDGFGPGGPLRLKAWAAGLLFAGTAFYLGTLVPPPPVAAPAPPVPAPASSPPERDIPAGPLGDAVRRGRDIVERTRETAGAFVGNDLRCANCHLDGGRLARAAPLGAAYVMFPAYRGKDGRVDTFAERLQGCFRFSMNGVAPPLGSEVLVALESYAAFLARRLPSGVEPPGRGFARLDPPAALDIGHGRAVYAAQCAQCHGADGAGQRGADGAVLFPPLWGPRSYNWGAGMSSVDDAAAFVKANMPLGQGGSLSDRDAWDVAAFVDSRDRPQDPRFTGSVAATRAAFHGGPRDLYGTVVDGVTLGEGAPASGMVGP